MLRGLWRRYAFFSSTVRKLRSADMKRYSFASRTIKFALLTLGAMAAGGVFAAEEVGELTVEATRETKVVGRSYTGAPIELVSLTRRVSYADLDLVTSSGAAELEKRVNETAKAACKQLDELYPLTAPGGPACVKSAVDEAMVEVRTAVSAAQAKAKAPATTN
jgi:UrcA family protein